MRIYILALIIALSGCATFNPDVPVEKRLQATQITLQAVEDTIPELVRSGDLTESDASKINDAIDKAQKIVDTAVTLANQGIPQDTIEQLQLAIDALRVAQDQVGSEKARQNIGRTIAALTITKSVMEQNQALTTVP